MKITTIVFFFLLFSTISTAQSINIDSCGLDNSSLLNNHEMAPFSLYSCSADGGDKQLILGTDGVKRSTVTAVEL